MRGPSRVQTQAEGAELVETPRQQQLPLDEGKT